jgi:hypothetical protein
MVSERFGAPTSRHGRRRIDRARSRAIDELAGRTVWCATALHGAHAPARRLQAALEWAGPDGVAASGLEVACDEPVREAGAHLEQMLGGGVRDGDVVVLHDALTAMLTEPIRERGAHAVWRVRVAPGLDTAAVEAVWSFLRDYSAGLDAYVVAWDGGVAALVPALDGVTAKQVGHGSSSQDLAWGSLLADVVHADRSEMVGGALHARPAVAAR